MGMKDLLMTVLKSRGVVTALVTTGTTGIYVVEKDRRRYPKMAHHFACGTILPPLSEHLHEVTYFHRPAIEKKLKGILSSSFSNEYYLVKGEVGSGKTRTLVELVREMQEESQGNGAPVYVSATQGKSFSDSLAKAVGFNFDEHMNFKYFLDVIFRVNSFPSQDENHKLVRTLEAIEVASFQFMEKNGKPAVIVIDSANYLAIHMPTALAKLQAKAKLWADTNIAKVIFVSNDERTEHELQAEPSAWSRAATPVHIGDLSKEDAVRYLTSPEFIEAEASLHKSQPMGADHAAEVADLVGGRIHHLITYKRNYLHGMDHDDIIDELMAREREKYLEVSKKPSQLKVLHTLYRAADKTKTLTSLVQNSSLEDVHALAHANLISQERHKRGMLVKFESKLSEAVFSEFESSGK